MSESRKEKMQADVVKGVLKLAESNDKEISLRNIADAVGVKAPTIYYYFKNSREIAVAVWEKLTTNHKSDKLYHYLNGKSELCELLFFRKDSRLKLADMNNTNANELLYSIRRSLENSGENNND